MQNMQEILARRYLGRCSLFLNKNLVAIASVIRALSICNHTRHEPVNGACFLLAHIIRLQRQVRQNNYFWCVLKDPSCGQTGYGGI